jgi:hypothetical protein
MLGAIVSCHAGPCMPEPDIHGLIPAARSHVVSWETKSPSHRL